MAIFNSYGSLPEGNHPIYHMGMDISPIDDGAQAETTERLTRAELDGATSRRAELECQTSAAQSEADSARTAGLWSYVELLWGVDSDWDFKMVLTTK